MAANCRAPAERAERPSCTPGSGGHTSATPGWEVAFAATGPGVREPAAALMGVLFIPQSAALVKHRCGGPATGEVPATAASLSGPYTQPRLVHELGGNLVERT